MSGGRRKHGTAKNVVEKVKDAVGGVAGRVSAAMTSSANHFVENAAIGDLYEIKAAELALRRSSSPQVKSFAEKMISDHTTSTHQLGAALEMNETKGVSSPPTELDSRRKAMLKHLEDASDDGFDSTYLDQQVLAHEETVKLMTGYRDKGDNVQLRSFAAGTAPVVERHLHRVKDAKKHQLAS